MTKRFTSLFVLTLLLIAMLAMTTNATRVQDEMAAKLRAYSLMEPGPAEELAQSGKIGATTSLGSDAGDGGSPGAIALRSYWDHPRWYSGGRMIGYGGTPQIHYVTMGQGTGGLDLGTAPQWLAYNMFDPTFAPNGVFLSTGITLNSDPLSYVTQEPQLAVDETGHAIPIGQSFKPSGVGQARIGIRNLEVFWDISGPGSWGTFIGDTLPLSLQKDPLGSIARPSIAYQEYNGTYVTHVLAREYYEPGGILLNGGSSYWRRVGGAGTYQGWTNPYHTYESGGSDCQVIASGNSPRVALIFLVDADDTNVDAGSTPAFVISDDMGANWGSIQKAVSIDNTNRDLDNFTAWVEVAGTFDQDGYIHIVFNSFPYFGATHATAGVINPSRILHWTNRVGGDVGTLSVVEHIEFNLNDFCGRGWYNEQNVARQVVSECNGRLYVLWQQFGDNTVADQNDCADGEAGGDDWYYAINSDIYMSVSLNTDGLLWDARRNLTNSKTPDCTGQPGNECDSDTYPTMAPFGMNTNPSVVGDTYWGAVAEAFEVRNAIAPDWPDTGNFLDVMFINDLFPGPNNWRDLGGISMVWTNSPLKWFRLPCIEPIVEPSINILGADFLYPGDWIKSGATEIVDLVVENLGNDGLIVSDISVVLNDAPPGSVTLGAASLLVEPGTASPFTVTLNPGGVINPGPGTAVRINATVNFTSDDPNHPLVSWDVNTVVVDSVMPVTWANVATDAGYGLLTSSLGGGGNTGEGDGGNNLDFVGTGEDCDLTEDIYLYEMSPLLMRSLTDYAWQPYWGAGAPETYHMVNVPGHIEPESGDGGGLSQFRTGTFVTPDSSIGMTKTFVTPTDGTGIAGTGFVLEKWELYSFDGGSHADVRLGVWHDWDIPGDSGYNVGGSEPTDDYIWIRGAEYNQDVDECIDNDLRFGFVGLAGYYLTSEKAGDPGVNHTGLYGGFTQTDDDIFVDGTNDLIPDSLWKLLNTNDFYENNIKGDQHTVVSFGSHTIPAPGDTLVIWTYHGSIYNGTLPAPGLEGTVGGPQAVAAVIEFIQNFYMDKRNDVGTFGCCGLFTGGRPGNIDCDAAGKMNLIDITRLIDRVYITKTPLCCEENGNVDGDVLAKINLIDITKLIDVVYITKTPPDPCL